MTECKEVIKDNFLENVNRFLVNNSGVTSQITNQLLKDLDLIHTTGCPKDMRFFTPLLLIKKLPKGFPVWSQVR